MAKLSSKLRSVPGGIMHWCPGCERAHVIYTEANGSRPTWTWDGDAERPTVTPSILCFTTAEPGGDKVLPGGARRTLCHYFLAGGNIVFCGDSPHAFAGSTVPLPDIPDDWGGGE